uniref:Uncharacterized protein n=1 Tax=Arundo donax TaxID=35708 RepID=A0A0A8YX43_ARUDO
MAILRAPPRPPLAGERRRMRRSIEREGGAGEKGGSQCQVGSCVQREEKKKQELCFRDYC